MEDPRRRSIKKWPDAMTTKISKLVSQLSIFKDRDKDRESLDSADTLVGNTHADKTNRARRPAVLKKSSRTARSLSAGILDIQIVQKAQQRQPANCIAESSSPPKITTSHTRSQSQSFNTGVQVNLPSPITANNNWTSTSNLSDDTVSTSETSTSTSSDYYPALEDYNGVYPTLTFGPNLSVAEWQLPSGSPPTITSNSASSSNPYPLTTFHPFPLLPTELRLKIWRLHLARPRLVRISTLDFVKKIHFQPNTLGNHSSNIQWYSTNRLPILSLVNRESRAETLRFYRCHLSSGMARRAFSFGPVYLNPEWDIILLNCSHEGTPMDVLLNDIMAYDPRGVGAVHLASYCDPALWDNAPLAGCLPLSTTAARLRSYTEVIYAGWSSRVDVFPILRLGQGYLQESVEVSGNEFRSFMRASQRGNFMWSHSKYLRQRLMKVFGEDMARQLSVQSLFTRTVVSPRGKPRPVSLATDKMGAGLVVWDREDPDSGKKVGGEDQGAGENDGVIGSALGDGNGGGEGSGDDAFSADNNGTGGGRFVYFSCN